ncbi:Cap-specific mRNA (nucleoside-2-O-)-methyltransferase [uncultured virus]|nr:Cap-specific mRNA (nucleoside-2-O-)-methyltransferase [uncultured virus]
MNKLGETVNLGIREQAELQNMIDSWHSDSIDQQHVRMKRMLSKARDVPAKRDNSRGNYKSKQIVDLLGKGARVSSLLDLGAGDGEIVTTLAKALRTKKDNTYALTVTELAPSTSYTRITYTETGAIPLPDASIDLVVMAQVLHHIHAEDRKLVLAEVKRVLSPTGHVVIQEHDYRGDLDTYIALDILHTFWYVKNSENPDGLYLMSKSQTVSMFEKLGMRLEQSTDARRWQWMYWASFTFGKPDSLLKLEEYSKSEQNATVLAAQALVPRDLQDFDPIDLYLTSLNKQLPYHEGRVGRSNSLYWGQLKLFLSILQALVEQWDVELVPKLTVVYAGAAPGWSFGVLHKLYPDIVWHLYDDHALDIEAVPGKIFFYKQYFTEATARHWSRYDNIFFFSDIRREGSDTLRGAALEAKIAEDMTMQANWVKIMNPYRASLKFRAPFLENPTIAQRTYLAGNVMVQSFNSQGSAETRLIPMRNSQGLYYDTIWDWKEYESMLFYRNSVTREVGVYRYVGEPDGIVSHPSGLDNHFESIHLLYVLDEYRSRVLGVTGGSSVPLAVRLMKDLSSYSKKGHIDLATIRAEGGEKDD